MIADESSGELSQSSVWVGARACRSATTSPSFCCSVGGSWRVWPSPAEPGGSGQNGAKLAEKSPGEIQLPELAGYVTAQLGRGRAAGDEPAAGGQRQRRLRRAPAARDGGRHEAQAGPWRRGDEAPVEPGSRSSRSGTAEPAAAAQGRGRRRARRRARGAARPGRALAAAHAGRARRLAVRPRGRSCCVGRLGRSPTLGAQPANDGAANAPERGRRARPGAWRRWRRRGTATLGQPNPCAASPRPWSNPRTLASLTNPGPAWLLSDATTAACPRSQRGSAPRGAPRRPPPRRHDSRSRPTPGPGPPPARAAWARSAPCRRTRVGDSPRPQIGVPSRCFPAPGAGTASGRAAERLPERGTPSSSTSSR